MKKFKAITINLMLLGVVGFSLPAWSNDTATVSDKSATSNAKNEIIKNAQPLDRIAAIVNDSIITNNELNVQIALVSETLKSRNMPLPPLNVLKKQVLEHMIDAELEMQLAKNAGVQVDSHDVDEAIADIAKRNNVNLAGMHKLVESQGMSWKDYRRNVKKELIISRLQQKAVGQIIITDQQADSYLASLSQSGNAQASSAYHLEDILIPLSANPSSQEVQAAEQRAKAVLEKLRKGANFNELAVAESGGQDALEGGDLGFRPLPELPEAFAKRVIEMKPGDLAGPIRTANGWHIIKLVAIRGGSAGGAAPTREQVKNFLYQRKYNEAVENWIMQLRNTAYIKTFL